MESRKKRRGVLNMDERVKEYIELIKDIDGSLIQTSEVNYHES